MSTVDFLTVTELSEQIRHRCISPVEVTRLCLDRINAYDGILSSYVTVTGDRALKQASLAEEEINHGRWRGPLHGVPIALKDLVSTKGILTTAGMSLYKDHVPLFNATVVERLERAGAVILGKLKTAEGALFNHHPTVVPPRNPWNTNYWSGVSSSGSGAATAAGLCFGALGTDTAGSIRMPSSFCGLTGIKPTWGRVSRFGVFALAGSLDCVGPMARSATDAAAILGVIAGSDPNDPTTLNAAVPDYLNQIREGVRGLRIGVDHAFATEGVNEEVVAALGETEATFRELGADVCETTVPALDHVSEAFLVLCSTEAATAHKEAYPEYAFEYGNELSELIQKGQQTTESQVAESLQERNRFVDGLSEVFQKIDLLLTPTLSFPAPRLDSIDFKRMTIAHENARSSPEDLYAATLRFTSLFNFGRNPAISFPAGFSSSGLPIGMQLAGRHLEEALLLRAVHAFQRSTGWHACHPADLYGAF
ncbi:MAG TPA: amidase [Chthoniobacterales bacterium]